MKHKRCEVFVVVLGSYGVGKSSTVIQYNKGYFLHDNDPTIEEIFRQYITVDGNEMILDILDTAPPGDFDHRYLQHFEQSMNKADGFVIIYDVTDRNSFEFVNQTVDTVVNLRGTNNLSVIIAGNKMDKSDDRVIDTDEGYNFAKDCKCEFLEISAKANHQIDLLFENLVKLIRKNIPLNSGIDQTTASKKKLSGDVENIHTSE